MSQFKKKKIRQKEATPTLKEAHPAAEVLHQVDLHSLYAAIAAACVNLQEANAQFDTTPLASGTREHREPPYHTLVNSHTHHRVAVTPVHLQTVM